MDENPTTPQVDTPVETPTPATPEPTRAEKLTEAYGNYSEVEVPQTTIVAHDVEEGDLSLLADNYSKRVKFSK